MFKHSSSGTPTITWVGKFRENYSYLHTLARTCIYAPPYNPTTHTTPYTHYNTYIYIQPTIHVTCKIPVCITHNPHQIWKPHMRRYYKNPVFILFTYYTHATQFFYLNTYTHMYLNEYTCKYTSQIDYTQENLYILHMHIHEHDKLPIHNEHITYIYSL